METTDQINARILEITLLINEKYPELSKYLEEIPVTIPENEHPDLSTKALKDYLNTLEELVKDYSGNHPSN